MTHHVLSTFALHDAFPIFVETDFDLSPRLGFNYDVFGDRSTSLKGFYGRYYIPIAANTNIRMAGNELFTEDYYRVASDRKSTRLNSSHLVISYAVFWLKKT